MLVVMFAVAPSTPLTASLIRPMASSTSAMAARTPSMARTTVRVLFWVAWIPGVDRFGGFGGQCGEALDLSGDNGKALARRACPCCLDRGIQGKQIGLARHLQNRPVDRTDFGTVLVQLLHTRRRVTNRRHRRLHRRRDGRPLFDGGAHRTFNISGIA